MEEHYDTPDPEFVKGFNDGYTIAKHLPGLSEQLSRADAPGARGDGFRAGRQQIATELEQRRQPAWMRPDFGKQAPDAPAADKHRDLDWEVDR